jgi:broad specificity phosphatase PhoE
VRDPPICAPSFARPGAVSTVPNRALPHGESIDDALRRYAEALRRLLARKEKVTLVVLHEIALRYIAAAAATGPSDPNDTAFPNAAPYLFDEPAVRRAVASLAGLTTTVK